jgi:hypothetical protein
LSCWMSRHAERLDLRDHDRFESCVGYKATSFCALHLFLEVAASDTWSTP